MSTKRLAQRVAAGVAGLAVAGGVLVGTASTAEASNVWDRVAACESSGNWHINTGNGYYGGLQFSAATWRGFGGGQYASRAHLASKAEQIAIARRVLAGQGPHAWPVCGPRAGLTRANGGADAHATATSHRSKKKKAARYVTVHRGDTLGKIAARYHVKGGWQGLWKLNKGKVKNPNSIYVGERLRVR